METLNWHIKFINDTNDKLLYMLTEMSMSSNTYLLNTEQ